MQLSRFIVADRVFVWFSLVLILMSWGMALWAWPELPARIPTHFSVTGTPDAWRTTTAWSVLFIPSLQIFLAGLLGLAYRYPQFANIPSTVAIMALAEPIRAKMFRLLRRMIVSIGLVAQLLFVHITLGVISIAFGVANRLNPWMMAGLLILSFVIVLRYTILAYRLTASDRAPNSTPKINSPTGRGT